MPQLQPGVHANSDRWLQPLEHSCRGVIYDLCWLRMRWFRVPVLVLQGLRPFAEGGGEGSEHNGVDTGRARRSSAFVYG